MNAHLSGKHPYLKAWSVHACLLVAAIIHLLPLPGVLGAAVLEPGYGLSALDPSTELLLQHRALIFGLMGAMLLTALRLPTWRVPAVVLVLASDIGFLALALIGWPLVPELVRVAVFDAVSILALLLAVAVLTQTSVPERADG